MGTRKTPAKVLGETLEEIRSDAGITQGEMALHLGHKGHSMVSKTESGDRSIPFWEYIEFCRLADKDPVAVLRQMLDRVPKRFAPPKPGGSKG